MAPWWIRPTSDEAQEADKKGAAAPPPSAKRAETSPERSSPAPIPSSRLARSASRPLPADEAENPNTDTVATSSADLAEAPAPEPESEEKPGSPRGRRTRSRRSRRGARSTEPEAASPQRFEEPEEIHEEEDSPSLETILREIFLESPSRANSEVEERKIALFCDFENIALGVRDSESKKFELNLVLDRLREKGKVIVKKAYSDWSRYSDFKKTFHESGIELIEIPQKYYSGKNSADIKMVVDAMDLCYSNEHLDTFVIMSGDSDFTPLVSKLKENNKYVIGLGVKNATSSLLIDNCDEFIYYEDVWRDAQTAPLMKGLKSTKDSEVFSLMTDAMLALIRENKEVLWGSMIKQTMKRKRPSFNEGYYGYRTFSELLEDAQRKGIIRLKRDQRSGSYIVSGFAESKR